MRWLAALLITLICMVPAAAQETTMYSIIGYYGSWTIYNDPPYLITDVPGDRLTHLMYAFVVLNADGECALMDPYGDLEFPYPDSDAALPGNLGQIPVLKERYPHLKIMMSVGGWTGSGGFSDAALTPESRARFADSCVQFMLDYGFDGIDIDWEFPVEGGPEGQTARPEDRENFAELLAALRARLDTRGAAEGRHYLLSIAAPTTGYLIEHYDWSRIEPLLDYIFVMAYDFAGTWNTVTGLNAPLYTDPASPFGETVSADAAIQTYLAYGIPPEKLILGTPFYGKGWSGVPDTDSGLYQPYTGLPDAQGAAQGAFDYRQIAALLEEGGFERYWNDAAQVPWLYRTKDGLMISYDDAESMAAKAAYVRELGLGGAGIWQMSGDDATSTLLNALYTGLNADG